MNVIGKIAKFILNFPKMIMDDLIVTLSVALYPVKMLKKTVDVICDNDRWVSRVAASQMIWSSSRNG